MKFRPMMLLSLVLLAACSVAGGEIEIKDAWIRPAEAGMNSAVYFVIDNPGEQERLIAAQSTIANAVEIHRSDIDATGVAHMEKLESVIIPAHDQLVFEPGGLHIMLLELSRDLVPDEEIQLRLHFEKQGDVTIDVPVEAP
jgi:copper(I)-binding protein